MNRSSREVEGGGGERDRYMRLAYRKPRQKMSHSMIFWYRHSLSL